MYRVKICGITTPDDALLAAEAGADAIGLNFYEKSARYVRAEQAGEIVERLREEYSAGRVQVFGVFVNATLDDILWKIRDADLYGIEKGFGIQLHGDELPELIGDLHRQGLGTSGDLFQVAGHVPVVPIVRAFRCRADNLSAERAYLERCQELGALPQAALLDAAVAGSYGGTGSTLDWPSLAGQRGQLQNLPLVLAGGLSPDNVAQAVAAAQPDAVDTASGVESSPGRKDAAKVFAFVARAREALAGNGSESGSA